MGQLLSASDRDSSSRHGSRSGKGRHGSRQDSRPTRVSKNVAARESDVDAPINIEVGPATHNSNMARKDSRISFKENIELINKPSEHDTTFDNEYKIRDSFGEEDFDRRRREHYRTNYIGFEEGKEIARKTMSGEDDLDLCTDNSAPVVPAKTSQSKSGSTVGFRDIRSKVEADESGHDTKITEFEYSNRERVSTTEDFSLKRKEHYGTYMSIDTARKLADQAMEEKTEWNSFEASNSTHSPGTTAATNNPVPSSSQAVGAHQFTSGSLKGIPRKDSVISFKETVEKIVTSEEKTMVFKEPVNDSLSAASGHPSEEFDAKRKEHYENYMSLEDARKLVEKTLREESEYADYSDL